jgi:hypothetical protein
MQQNGVFDFWRNPPSAAGTVLLKVHFVGGPQIDTVVFHELLEFFYAPAVVPDWLEQ